MLKGWKCKHCGSAQLKPLRQIKTEGKWVVQGDCEDCGSIMRFTKYNSWIYKLAAEKIKVPF